MLNLSWELRLLVTQLGFWATFAVSSSYFANNLIMFDLHFIVWAICQAGNIWPPSIRRLAWVLLDPVDNGREICSDISPSDRRQFWWMFDFSAAEYLVLWLYSSCINLCVYFFADFLFINLWVYSFASPSVIVLTHMCTYSDALLFFLG